MSTFSLQIISSNRTFYHGKAEIVILPSVDGQLAIMAHHEEMAVAVETGEIKFRLEDGSWITGVVSKGLAEVANNRVNIYVYSCEKPEEIDIRRAEEARDMAEEQLRQKRSIVEYQASQAALARAMARLKAAGQVKPTGY